VSSTAIVADGLSKAYGDEDAVAELDLAVDRGAVYGFLGPNGAGKTTTMRMLTTLTAPTAGSARVAGADVRDRAAVVPHVGYLPEEPPVFDELTGREQLEYAAGLRDLGSEEAATRIDESLSRFGLAGDADERVAGYSKGMRRKLGLVQATLHDPDVLFLDEPTSGLDPRAARTVKQLLRELRAGETTVFLSTHILPVVDELADEVGVLADGRLVAEGSPEALKSRAEAGSEPSLEDVFLAVTREDDRERGRGREQGQGPARGRGRGGGRSSGHRSGREEGAE
jgi:ABC-2 type transport system ATP-binding protein